MVSVRFNLFSKFDMKFRSNLSVFQNVSPNRAKMILFFLSPTELLAVRSRGIFVIWNKGREKGAVVMAKYCSPRCGRPQRRRWQGREILTPPRAFRRSSPTRCHTDREASAGSASSSSPPTLPQAAPPRSAGAASPSTS